MPLLLTIEDDADLQRILQFNLQAAGHQVVQALTGRDGLRLARTQPPSLIVLDLMLPDMSGSDVCRTLKRDAQLQDVPVVMLTARGEEVDRIVGLELGAEDYVVKPFSVRELVLRIDAILRRSQAAPVAGPVVTAGVLAVDKAAHRVTVAGQPVELTHLEFKLLALLLDRRERAQSRDALIEALWGGQSDVDERAIDTHVKRLREKLGAAAGYLETVRGTGYRLSVPAKLV